MPTLRSRIFFRKSELSLEAIIQLKERLTFENPDYATVVRFSPYTRTNVPPTVCLAEEDDETFSVPRGTDFSGIRENSLTRALSKIEDKRHSVPASFPDAKLVLNDEQSVMFRAVRDAVRTGKRPYGTWLLIASTSTGKTILQARLAAYSGQKTLVLCRTNAIQKAWIDDLGKLYGLAPKQIGRIQQSTFRIGDQFTLSSLSTLHRRQARWEEIFAHFGCVIMDEVHLLPANTIYAFVRQCPAKYMIGATATIKKSDEKKRRIVYSTFGSPIKELDTTMKETASSMPITGVREVRTNFIKVMPREMFDRNALFSALTADDERNSLVVTEVFKDYAEGHYCLVTTSRVDHAMLLQAMLAEAEVHAEVLVGTSNSSTQYARIVSDIEQGKLRCLISTDQLISVGANIPRLDRLHITTPIKDDNKLNQLCGRIRRKAPGKTDAYIVYYVDRGQSYLYNIFKSSALKVFRQLNIDRYKRMFLA